MRTDQQAHHDGARGGLGERRLNTTGMAAMTIAPPGSIPQGGTPQPSAPGIDSVRTAFQAVLGAT